MCKTKTELALDWWQELIEVDKCEEIEKKCGYYGHDIGSNERDIIRMYEMEVLDSSKDIN